MMWSATISKWVHRAHQSARMLMPLSITPPPGKGRVKRWHVWLESLKDVIARCSLLLQLQRDRIIVHFCVAEVFFWRAVGNINCPLFILQLLLFQRSGLGLVCQTQPAKSGQGPRDGGWRCYPAGEEVIRRPDCTASASLSSLAAAHPLKHVHIEYRLVCTIKTHERIFSLSPLCHFSPQTCHDCSRRPFFPSL